MTLMVCFFKTQQAAKKPPQTVCACTDTCLNATIFRIISHSCTTDIWWLKHTTYESCTVSHCIYVCSNNRASTPWSKSLPCVSSTLLQSEPIKQHIKFDSTWPPFALNSLPLFMHTTLHQGQNHCNWVHTLTYCNERKINLERSRFLHSFKGYKLADCKCNLFYLVMCQALRAGADGQAKQPQAKWISTQRNATTASNVGRTLP